MRHITDPQHRLFDNGLPPVQLGTAILGAALLVAGRRLFWLFVGALGFVTATDFVAPFIDPQNHTFLLIIGVIAGIAGALLAIFVQKVAVALAGAVAGAYYVKIFADMASLQELGWIAALVGAILGAFLMVLLFKWALIVFSSIAGAHLITQALPLSPQLGGAAFLVLLIIGIIVQARQLRAD